MGPDVLSDLFLLLQMSNYLNVCLTTGFLKYSLHLSMTAMAQDLRTSLRSSTKHLSAFIPI